MSFKSQVRIVNLADVIAGAAYFKLALELYKVARKK